MKIKISIIQMNIVTGQVEQNLETANRLFQEIAKDKPNFVVLPEMWNTGFAYADLEGIARQSQETTIAFLSAWAKKLKSYVIGGSIPEVIGKKVFNSCFAFNPDGKIIGKYHKAHLFQPTREDKFFAAGHKSPILNTVFGKVSMVICYDLRFPEITRKLTIKGAQIIFVPAQFPGQREETWKILIRARAIENQVFMVGANRVGGKKISHSGRSMVVGPDGSVIGEMETGEEARTFTIDMKNLWHQRKVIPSLEARNRKAYKLT